MKRSGWLLVAGALLACGRTSTRALDRQALENPWEQNCLGEHDFLECTMRDARCPASSLPTIHADDFDSSVWERLEGLAAQNVVGVRHAAAGGTFELVEACRLPGAYHEVAANADSPGRGWAADRLIFVADELEDCAGATHAIAAFGLANDGPKRGAAVLVPIICPPLDHPDPPAACLGAGLSPSEREARVQTLMERADELQMLRVSDQEIWPERLAVSFDLIALHPSPNTAGWLVFQLQDLDRHYGGCFVAAEVHWYAHSLDPSLEGRYLDATAGRPRLSHDAVDCGSRPSFMTCFPDVFVPGMGDNCW